jgi:hypothetical protein
MSDASGWLAGGSSMTFGVPRSTPMGGYADRKGPSTGTLDPLTISVLALSAGDAELCIVSVDLVAVDEALSQRVADAAGIGPGSLLLAASHTHSGPAGISTPLHPAIPDEIDHLRRGSMVLLSKLRIDEARALQAPATVSLGRSALSGFAANRNDRDGSYDPTVSALVVRDETGSLVAIVVHWACHPTILSAKNRRISADFPGVMRRHLRAKLDAPDLPVLYLNGAAGDVSTRFTRNDQTPEEVERVGSALAGATLEAMEHAEPLPAQLAHATTSVRLTGWSPQQISAALSQIDEPAKDASRLSTTRAQGHSMLRSLADSPCRPRRKSVRVDAWNVGGLALLAVPGELVSGLGQQIVAASPLQTLVVGYAGGYAGYLAERDSYEAGTYEALASQFGPGSGEAVADAASDLLKTLAGSAELRTRTAG